MNVFSENREVPLGG